MHRHQPNPVGALFEHGRFSRFRFLRLRFKLFDKSTKRNSARRFEASREVGYSVDISEHLMSGRPQGESGVSARSLEQSVHGACDGTAVTAARQVGELRQGVGDGAKIRREIVRKVSERMQPANFMEKTQQ